METDIDDPIPLTMDELQEQLESIESNLSQLQSTIISENEKMHKYKVADISDQTSTKHTNLSLYY